MIYIVFETYIVNKDLHDECIKNFLKNCKQCDWYYLQNNLITKNVEYMTKKIPIHSIERLPFCIDKNTNNSNELH